MSERNESCASDPRSELEEDVWIVNGGSETSCGRSRRKKRESEKRKLGTTRVLVVPGEELVTGGPYRWLRHPNYLVVVLEIAAIPAVHGAWLTAVLFSIANLVLLRERVRVENRALNRLAAGGTG